MLRKSGRDTGRTLNRRQLPGGLFLGRLDTPLDIANRVKILADLGAVIGTETAYESRRSLADKVENAAVRLDSRQLLRLVSAVAVSKQPFKHCARLVLHRQRSRGTGPTNRIGIG